MADILFWSWHHAGLSCSSQIYTPAPAPAPTTAPAATPAHTPAAAAAPAPQTKLVANTKTVECNPISPYSICNPSVSLAMCQVYSHFAMF